MQKKKIPKINIFTFDVSNVWLVEVKPASYHMAIREHFLNS